MGIFSGNKESPPIDVNGVPAFIYVGDDGEQGGIIESWTDRGLEFTVFFHVDWADRIDFIRKLRGSVSYLGNNILRLLPWTIPIPDTDSLKWSRYLCVGTDPFIPKKFRTNQDTGWGEYDTVVIPAHFATTPYQVGDGQIPTAAQNDPSGLPYTSCKFHSTGEVFAPSSQFYSFANHPDVKVEDVGVAIWRTRTEINITRYFMPIIPLNELQAVINTVNKKPMNFSNVQYAEESILCTSIENSEPYGDPGNGLLVQDIHYVLIANGPSPDPADKGETLSWNKFLMPFTPGPGAAASASTWDKLVDGNGNPPYRSTNLQHAIWPDYID